MIVVWSGSRMIPHIALLEADEAILTLETTRFYFWFVWRGTLIGGRAYDLRKGDGLVKRLTYGDVAGMGSPPAKKRGKKEETCSEQGLLLASVSQKAPNNLLASTAYRV